MRTLLLSITALTALAGGTVVIAQMPSAPPGSKDTARITGGTYTVDGNHTQIAFAFDHMGFTNNMGIFAMPTGTLTLDPKAPAAAKVSIDIPVANLRTGVPAFDTHLMSADFFDAKKFPTAKFVSTGVKVDGDDATITGNLTLKNITKPVTLDAEFYGAGTLEGKENVGFVATTTIKRSDYGMDMAVPAVSDAIELKITAAFVK